MGESIIPRRGTPVWEERIPVALIPTMTSATTPSGVASSSSNYKTYQEYKCFDNDYSSFWSSAYADTNGWVQYQFANDVVINKIELKTLPVDGTYSTVTNGEVRVSNDGSIWTAIQTLSNLAVNTIYTYDVIPVTCKYIRIVITANNNTWDLGRRMLNNLQCWGYNL